MITKEEILAKIASKEILDKLNTQELLDKISDIYEGSKLSDIEALNKIVGYKKEEEKKTSPLIWVFAIIGVIVAVAGIAFLAYKYFQPDYLEDFEDDFDDDFEDEFFEDEDVDGE